ncbi:class I SAM-dependent methyltransferase [bacterium]|nr:MAG: class I SAM-dependent methyltransferase [bacterium]
MIPGREAMSTTFAEVSRREREAWDRHWRTLEDESTFFGRLASLVRKGILRRAVRHYAERYFPARGLFVEMGCGTAQASASIEPRERRFAGLDLSLPALLAARGNPPHRHVLGGDLRHLPFPDGSVAGIWNLGVMEHFPAGQGIGILRELRRVLAPGAYAILFWPPSFGSSRWALAPIEWLRTRVDGRPFRFFPDEVNRLASHDHARRMVLAGGLEPVAVDFSFRDCFIHMVVVARKPLP